MGQVISKVLSDTKEIYLLSLGINVGAFLLHALPQRSEKYYDLVGSLTYTACALYSFFRPRPGPPIQLSSWRLPALATACLLLWCNRLGFFLFRRILAAGSDRRFNNIKTSMGMFLFAWIMQAHWNYIVGLPVYLLNTYRAKNPNPRTANSSVPLLCLLSWLAGFLIEVLADEQKRNFLSNPAHTGRFISQGLWSLCRHPNYLGELIMWTSLAFLAYHSLKNDDTDCPEPRLAFASPLFTFYLLRFLSGIPLLERHGLKVWGHLPAYQHYLNHTPRLLPGWSNLTGAIPSPPS
jgi:steroid 5-alpha reductase family enzyme